VIKQFCIQVGTLLAVGVLLVVVYFIAIEVPQNVYRAYINAGVGVVIGLLLADGVKVHRNKQDCKRQEGGDKE
jgi:hypothetical protein